MRTSALDFRAQPTHSLSSAVPANQIVVDSQVHRVVGPAVGAEAELKIHRSFIGIRGGDLSGIMRADSLRYSPMAGSGYRRRRLNWDEAGTRPEAARGGNAPPGVTVGAELANGAGEPRDSVLGLSFIS